MAVEERTLTEALVTQRLEEVLQPKFDNAEFRLSESLQCRRKRVARALGYAAEEFSREDAEYFERGNIVEQWIVGMYRETFPRRTRRQVLVETPYRATGHIDLWFPAERKIVEVKSLSERAVYYGLPKAEHANQVQAYLWFFRDPDGVRRAASAELVYVLVGTRLQLRTYPILPRDEIGQAIEAELYELQSYVERRELPPVEFGPEDYPCYWATRMGEHKCPFYGHCHDLTDSAVVNTAESVADLVAEYGPVVDEWRSAKQHAENLETQKKHLESVLAQVMDEAVEAIGGGYRLRRAEVPGRVTYDVDAAIRCGAVDGAALEPFRSHGQGYTRWTVKKEVAKSA